MIHFLFPSDDFNPKVVDPDYADELDAITKLGIGHSLFSFEDFKSGTFKAVPNNLTGKIVVYRGWMMTPEQYASLDAALVTNGAYLLTTPRNYKAAHHMREWYSYVSEFTPFTVFATSREQVNEWVEDLDWPKYFVKDSVKSLTTSRGSIATSGAEVHDILDQLIQYRGGIEGVICLREVESFKVETEKRYLSINGKVWAADGNVPDVVQHIASRFNMPFFSIDMVENSQGELRLIEIGDGQVSSRKEWSASDFITALTFGMAC